MVRHKILLITLLVLAGSCTPATRFIVTNIGYEPEEVQQSFIYALPQTNLIVGINFEKQVFLPGPYCDYALKQLGINGVNRTRKESYKIFGTELYKSIEADQDHIYALNVLEGEYSMLEVNELVQNGFVLTNNLYTEMEIIQNSANAISSGGIHFKEVTMEPNIEMKEETMYKTILTDTSFIRVPVVSEQLERKTLEKKAEEAAKLILEIRSDRYFLAAGIVDPFPQDFDLKIALTALDELEEKYLSLFIGKSYTQGYYREFFILPKGSMETEEFTIGAFSNEAGFVSDGSGEELKVEITPVGKTKSMRNLLPQHPEEEVYNKLYYRMPEMTVVDILKGEDLVHQERIALFQSGALVNVIQ